MQSYIPEESFLSQYPDWAGLPMEYFKCLPASRNLKQTGALLFIEGQVTEFKSLRDRHGFIARVKDRKTYGTSVWVEPGTKSPAFDCGCSRPNKTALCTHALAVLAALDYLFHEHNFLPLSPLTDNVKRLAAQIDRSSKKKRKTLRRIRICGLQGAAPYLEGDAALGDGLIQAINPYGEMRRLARNTVELPMHDLKEKLRVLVDFVRDSRNMKLEAESPEGDFIELKPELVSIGSRLRFEADTRKNIVRIEEVTESIKSSQILAQLDAKHYIFRDGRIAYVDEQRTRSLQDAYIDMEEGFSAFSRKSHEWSIDYVNDCTVRLGHRERRLYRQCDFCLPPGVEPQPEPASGKAPARKLKLSLDLHRIHNSHLPGYLASIQGEVEEQHVIVHRIFADFMAKLVHHARDSERLLGRRERCEQLLEAAAFMPSIRSQKERADYIQKVAQRATFEKPQQKKAVRKFLQQIEKDYCRPKSNLIPLCLYEDVIDEDCPAAWHPVQLPLEALLALTATLYRHSAFQQILGARLDAIVVSAGGDLLNELTDLCERWGISLRIDESVTQMRPTVVELLIESTGEMDWFELKPTVRCEGLDIPPEDWERLLAGKLVLEGEDGSLLLPRVEQSDAFEAMIETFGPSREGATTKPVHRLHLLDWIALRARGLAVALPPEVETLYASLKQFERIPEQPMPKGMHAELRPYQKLGYEWLVFLYQHRLGACLADDMGLGKTLQALAFLGYLQAKSSRKSPLRALAVLPTSLLFNWQSEAARFLPGLSVACYSGSERDTALLDTHELTLTSYDLLWRDSEAFAGRDFDLVIFDEAQALKNPRSRRATAARRLSRRFTLCITGTPMENHPGEFHTLMDLALPGLMGSRKQFDEALRAGNDRPLQRARPFLLRRTKDAILKELPPKVETDVHLEMNEEQRSIYTRIVGELREEVAAAYRKQTKAQAGISALAALTKLRQLCISPALLGHHIQQPAPKMEHLLDQLLELNEEGHSVLVFSQFVRALDQLEKTLKQAGHTPLRLDGSTPAKARGKAVDQFQNSDTPRTFLISLKAGGTGLNLTRASHVFHLDPWWNPAVENQASDRAHRIGQQQTVFIHRLLMRDSIEEKIMTLKARKQKLFQAVVEDPAAARKKGPIIGKEDFAFLLEG